VRKVRVFWAMIFWAVLVHGASFDSQSGQAKEQTPATSGEKSASNSSPKDSKNTEAPGQQVQTGNFSDDSQRSFSAVKQGTAKRYQMASHAKPAPSHQQRSVKASAAKNIQMEVPRNVRDSHQAIPTLPGNVPGRTVSHSSRPVSRPTVALNAQQFKNSRDPGARMLSAGGPATSTRGTAAINGSDMKRKP
jgi:hypothetical protein